MKQKTPLDLRTFFLGILLIVVLSLTACAIDRSRKPVEPTKPTASLVPLYGDHYMNTGTFEDTTLPSQVKPVLPITTYQEKLTISLPPTKCRQILEHDLEISGVNKDYVTGKVTITFAK